MGNMTSRIWTYKAGKEGEWPPNFGRHGGERGLCSLTFGEEGAGMALRIFSITRELCFWILEGMWEEEGKWGKVPRH